MFPTPCIPLEELKSMRRPGSHSSTYHPPEVGRSNGPNKQMGEVRPLQTWEKGLTVEH